MDPSLFNKKKLFSFRGKATKGVQTKQQQRNKEQEIQEFAEEGFNVQQYISDYYTKTTPDKTPEHIDHLQYLLNNTNDLLKSYVYQNHTAFVHASNRTATVESDIVFLSSLINNLKLSVNTLPNETISIDPVSEQRSSLHNNLTMFGMDKDHNSFVLQGKKNQSGQVDTTPSLTGISGLYNRENLIKVQMFKSNNGNNNNNNDKNFDSNDENELLNFSSIKDKYAKYIADTTTAKYKDENGAVIGSLNNINIPTNETINLVESSEDLQSLIFERRLPEAVNLVELFVVLGVIPPILQFDQSILDDITTERKNNKDDDLSSLSILRNNNSNENDNKNHKNKNNNIDPKLHYTSLDYTDNAVTNVQTPNPAHLRHRMIMSKSILHENNANFINPPLHFRPQTTTTAVHITNNIINKNHYQLQLEDVNRGLLSTNDSLELSKARAFDNSAELLRFNDGQYTFQPILNLPQLPRVPMAIRSGTVGSIQPSQQQHQQQSQRPGSPKQSLIEHSQLTSLAPTPTLHASIYGFGKQPPPSSWRLQHQMNTVQSQVAASSTRNSNKQQMFKNASQNVITIRNNKVEKNTNLTHHFTKQTEVSTHIGKLVTVLVSLLLDEMTDFVGTSWEQDQRMLLLCRLNQHHLALHRYLVLQSQHTQEVLKKTRYKGDLRIFTLSICNIVYSNIQSTIRDFKRFFCNPGNNQPPTYPPSTISSSSSSSTTTSSNTSSTSTSSTTTTTTTMIVSTLIPQNTYTYLRDDLLAHLSTWIVLEITRLGKLIETQLLNQDDKFSNFPSCINAVYEASLQTEHLLGTTTCNILVQCLHPSIVRTINTISRGIEKEMNEYMFRDDWSPQPLNFTLVPISLQTPKDLLAKEAVEMIEANQAVAKWREQRNEVMNEYKAKLRDYRKSQRMLEKNKKKSSSILNDDTTANTTTKETTNKDSDDDDDDDDNNTHRDDDNNNETKTTPRSLGSNAPVMPPMPPLPKGLDDIIHDKIRLNISGFAIQIYRTLLNFSKQLLSVLLCPIWRVSQQSIETVSIDVLCSCIDKVTKAIASIIRKHLATLVSPLPPDYIDFLTATNKLDPKDKNNNAIEMGQQLQKKQDQVNKDNMLTPFLPSARPAVDPNAAKSSLAYKTTALPSIQEQENKMIDIQGFANTLQQTTTAGGSGVSGTGSSKRSFRPLSEVQLAILLNSLSFISHYVFPYISLFISVNLCKPIPELLNACYKQKKLTLTAFEHVTRKKAQFLLRGRWYVQQEMQYRETLENQRLLIEKYVRENNREALLRHQDSIIPLPNFRENHDNINTAHLPFNGALFWCDGEELNQRYASLPDFPGTPSLSSISNHMLSFLCHVYQQWHSCAYVFTPHQAKFMLRLLIDEICTELLKTVGWDVIFPQRTAALYMVCDIKVMLYFSFALFGIFEETKGKRDALVRRITRIYAKQYIQSYLVQYKQQQRLEKKQQQERLTQQTTTTTTTDNDKEDDKKSSNTDTTSNSSNTNTTTTTTLNGKTTKTTTTTTTTSSSSSSSTTTSDSLIPLTSNIETSVIKPLGLAQSTALLAASTSVRAMSMDDLQNEQFINDRNNEIDLAPEYYKQVTKLLLEHCGKLYLKDIKNYNCQNTK